MSTIRIKVRKGYVLFVGSKEYPEDSVLEVDEKEVLDQKWKYEKVKTKQEEKTVSEDIAQNRMIKDKDTKKKGVKN